MEQCRLHLDQLGRLGGRGRRGGRTDAVEIRTERLPARETVERNLESLPRRGAAAAEAGLEALAGQREAARTQDRLRRVGVLAKKSVAEEREEESAAAGGRVAAAHRLPARLREPAHVIRVVRERIRLARCRGHSRPGEVGRAELEADARERRLEGEIEGARQGESLLAAREGVVRIAVRMDAGDRARHSARRSGSSPVRR